MAYINFSETLSHPAPAPAAVRSAASVEEARQAQPEFSSLEWLVIGLARNDGLSSLSTPGRLARALRSLFGLGDRSGLADSRLERLRRMAVLVWHHGWQIPEKEVAAFLGEFSSDQLEALVASVGRQKSRVRRRVAA